MRIDLHTHSSRSDGTDNPQELVRRARAAAIDVVALTDHDTTAGWDEAQAAAGDGGITLVLGLEISCRFAATGVHLLAYEPDPSYPALDAELERVLAGRNARLPTTLHRLRGLNIDISVADVRAVSADAAATGRPHVADALVRLGAVRDRDEAFDRYLSPGRPAYVDRYGADLVTMIGLVRDAGGVSVVAHPWGRSSRRVLTEAAFEQLRDAGLAGIEVDHNDHSARDRAELAAIADELGLLRTGASDYHGVGKLGHPLGCNRTAPQQYEALRQRVREATRAAGSL
ncbi:MAG: PHP domain-containing protein [Nocardioidaceae bacterium]|nr:PHP domain-containing protein [Nocardioidaceae bacterium]